MFTQCPKCGHQPLPHDQNIPAACPACGVILAKVAQALKEDLGNTVIRTDRIRLKRRIQSTQLEVNDEPSLFKFMFHSPVRSDPMTFWLHVALLVGFAIWGWILITQDYRTGEIGASFIHKPLLIFHEAGHVVFRLLGEWMMMLGGSLGQLIMPTVLGVALLVKNRDPFGASIGLWLLGVSLLDLARHWFSSITYKSCLFLTA